MNYEVLGIDLGTFKMALATSRYAKPNESRVVTTPGGMKSVPPSVGFRGKSRFVGEAASMQSRSNAENTIEDVAFYIGGATAPADSSIEYFRRWNLQEGCAEVTYNGSNTKFDLRAITSMLFNQARTFQSEQRSREGAVATKEGEPCNVSIAIPDSYSEEQKSAISDAARLANLDLVSITTTSGALAASYQSGRSQDGEMKENTVMFVDIGHTCTSVSISKFGGETPSTSFVESSSNLGARNVDLSLYTYIVEELGKKGNTVKPRTKASSSVLRECAKAKKILSSNRETQLFMEQYGMNIKVKREIVDEKCKNDCDELKRMIAACLSSADMTSEQLLAVEMSGGGSRIPCYREAVSSAVGGASKLQTTLSPEAVAQGAATFGCHFVNELKSCEYEQEKRVRDAARKAAAILQKVKDAEEASKNKNKEETPKEIDSKEGDASKESDKEQEDEPTAPEVAATEAASAASTDETEAVEELKELPPIVFPTSSVPATTMTEEERKNFLSMEEEMKRVDAELQLIEQSKNNLESFIYEMQSVLDGNGKYGKHSNLLDKEKLTPMLNDTQQQLWDAEEAAGADVFVDLLESLKKKFHEISPDYFEKVKEEKAAEEAEMVKAEKEAEEERKANGEDDDHDRRKLKSADRMRLVQRNKDEAAELFKGKNYAHAAARYTKSLGHCSKFVDMTPEVKKQVEDTKVILYLNLAQCYLKLEQWNKVIPNCKDALSFDDQNIKAYYRRAYAYIKLKKIDDANKDVKKALKIAADDKSLLKLKKIIDAHLLKQKKKEAKMAKAMFGGK
jgi:molecular chaperone DnaK (HSP70)